MLICLYQVRHFGFLLGAALCLLLSGGWAMAQDAGASGKSEVAGFLRAKAANASTGFSDKATVRQSFYYTNGLICFAAGIDGQTGTFILDTGAPQMLINNRGLHGARFSSNPMGAAAGGAVKLSDRFVRSFHLSGREYRKLWALGLDLRPLENRLGDSIAGFVGYDLLRNSEVRIDYRRGQFSLLRSRRAPLHDGRPADVVLPFKLAGHLPVVTIMVGEAKLSLAVDTGASTNLLDHEHSHLTTPRARQISVQGLDGQTQILNQATLREESVELTDLSTNQFTLLDLSSLQENGTEINVDGILGSPFLENFTVGIDYRRNRLYLWRLPTQTSK